MIWLLYITLVTLLCSANSEYYHEFSKKIFNVTSGHYSYFGYSIAYESQSKTLIVSAPLSNIAGDVYLCNIDKGSCDPVKTDVYSKCTENKISGEENMWLGAVVKSAPSYYVTCAPRCMKQDLRFGQTTTEGRCFIGYSSKMTTPEHLKPISNKYRYEGFSKIEDTMHSYGWSLDVFEKQSIAIGGPAMSSGRLERYSKFDDRPTYIDGDVRGVNFNFGYSVASGYFIKNQDISYAVGSPYGTHGYGKVVILSSQLTYQGTLVRDDYTHKGSMYQVGAMYGAVLCTASFTGKMTDLLVGAPTYAAEHRQNTGAVYVYVRGKSNMPVYKRTIIGDHDNSYFGSAIVSIGDLNNDQKDEFAIAAPYEADGRGAVYLYSGADVLRVGKPFHPLQRIPPQENWRTFGLSLSALQDCDDNGCNEIAIGAPESDKVMLLRCMASVYIEVHIEVPDFKTDKSNSRTPSRRDSFEFKSCLKVRFPEKPKDISAAIEMKAEITHQDAKLKYPKQATYQVVLQRKQDIYCKNIEVLMPENGNYDEEIGIHVTASQIDNPIEQRIFDSSRVVLSDNSVLENDTSVWAAECSGNHRCMPDLVYTKTEFSVPRKYVIGSSPTISATIWVVNKGEVAYDACVHVQVYSASVLIAPVGCERVEDRPQYSWLVCSPKQLLRTGNTWGCEGRLTCGTEKRERREFSLASRMSVTPRIPVTPKENTNQITLDTTLLTNMDERIVIEGTIFNHCKDSNNTKKFHETIDLVSDTNGVTVRGLTDFGAENYVNMTKSDIAIGKTFEHVYEISNNGPTTWVDVDFQVEVKQLPFIEIYNVTIQINDAEYKCTNTDVKTNTINNLIFKCKLEKLSKYPIVMLLPMRVKPGAVGDLIKKEKKIIVYSELTFVLHDQKKSASVTSILSKREATVPLWVILSTACLGLVILAIIGLILRELGFLRRKNKDKLERVRQSVRRQTIMRRQSQNVRLERGRVRNEEMQAMLAEAAKQKHDRRVRVPSTE